MVRSIGGTVARARSVATLVRHFAFERRPNGTARQPHWGRSLNSDKLKPFRLGSCGSIGVV